MMNASQKHYLVKNEQGLVLDGQIRGTLVGNMWLRERDCPHLPDVEYLILTATALASEAYGLGIHRKVREMVGDEKCVPPLANVYLTLSRLEMKGLCRSYLCGGRACPGRRPKRLYDVTAEGNAALKHSMWQILKLFKDGPWN
jgi:DNA-binding PadR family transcriptional regulator